MRTSISTTALAFALLAAGGAMAAHSSGGFAAHSDFGSMRSFNSFRPMSRPTTTTTRSTPTIVKGPVRMTGQPNQTCGSPGALETPGNAASAPGSAFNPDGKAGAVYAGQQPQNSVNPNSVSQYDVACSKQK